MQAPYYKIYLGEDRVDITFICSNFVYEDCIEEDSLLKLDITPDDTDSADDIKTGRFIYFQFGYIGGELSDMQKSRITDIKYKYSKGLKITINCLDLGTIVRKVPSKKIWSDITSSDIAKEIADKYNLDSDIEETTKVWEKLPQGNRTDFSFLSYLAERADSGTYITYIRNNILSFKKSDLKKDSVRSFNYKDSNGYITSFSASEEESSMSSSVGGVDVMTSNKKTGEETKKDVNNKTENKTGTLGTHNPEISNPDVYNLNSFSAKTDNTTVRNAYVSVPDIPSPKYSIAVKSNDDTDNPNDYTDNVGKKTPSYYINMLKKSYSEPTEDKEEASNVANHKKKQATLSIITGKLKLVGQPFIAPDTVITIKGVANRHIGNWYVVKVVHKLSSSGYSTSLSLKKNGTSIGNTTLVSDKDEDNKAEDANTTEGADESDTSKEVDYVKVNEDGKEVDENYYRRNNGNSYDNR